jgi:hypothetical protein
MSTKEFNATRNGQLALAYNGLSVSVVMLLNEKVKQLGGNPWQSDFIQTANQTTLKSIQEDLILEYNALLTKPSLTA